MKYEKEEEEKKARGVQLVKDTKKAEKQIRRLNRKVEYAEWCSQRAIEEAASTFAAQKNAQHKAAEREASRSEDQRRNMQMLLKHQRKEVEKRPKMDLSAKYKSWSPSSSSNLSSSTKLTQEDEEEEAEDLEEVEEEKEVAEEDLEEWPEEAVEDDKVSGMVEPETPRVGRKKRKLGVRKRSILRRKMMKKRAHLEAIMADTDRTVKWTEEKKSSKKKGLSSSAEDSISISEISSIEDFRTRYSSPASSKASRARSSGKRPHTYHPTKVKLRRIEDDPLRSMLQQDKMSRTGRRAGKGKGRAVATDKSTLEDVADYDPDKQSHLLLALTKISMPWVEEETRLLSDISHTGSAAESGTISASSQLEDLIEESEESESSGDEQHAEIRDARESTIYRKIDSFLLEIATAMEEAEDEGERGEEEEEKGEREEEEEEKEQGKIRKKKKKGEEREERRGARREKKRKEKKKEEREEEREERRKFYSYPKRRRSKGRKSSDFEEEKENLSLSRGSSEAVVSEHEGTVDEDGEGAATKRKPGQKSRRAIKKKQVSKKGQVSVVKEYESSEFEEESSDSEQHLQDRDRRKKRKDEGEELGKYELEWDASKKRQRKQKKTDIKKRLAKEMRSKDIELLDQDLSQDIRRKAYDSELDVESVEGSSSDETKKLMKEKRDLSRAKKQKKPVSYPTARPRQKPIKLEEKIEEPEESMEEPLSDESISKESSKESLTGIHGRGRAAKTTRARPRLKKPTAATKTEEAEESVKSAALVKKPKRRKPVPSPKTPPEEGESPTPVRYAKAGVKSALIDLESTIEETELEAELGVKTGGAFVQERESDFMRRRRSEFDKKRRSDFVQGKRSEILQGRGSEFVQGRGSEFAQGRGSEFFPRKRSDFSPMGDIYYPESRKAEPSRVSRMRSMKAAPAERSYKSRAIPGLKVTWRWTGQQRLVCQHPTLGDMTPRPPIMPRAVNLGLASRDIILQAPITPTGVFSLNTFFVLFCLVETPDWWEQQNFQPEAFYDHETYSRENDDVLPTLDDPDLPKLTLRDFVTPGPWLLEHPGMVPTIAADQYTVKADKFQLIRLLKNTSASQQLRVDWTRPSITRAQGGLEKTQHHKSSGWVGIDPASQELRVGWNRPSITRVQAECQVLESRKAAWPSFEEGNAPFGYGDIQNNFSSNGRDVWPLPPHDLRETKPSAISRAPSKNGQVQETVTGKQRKQVAAPQNYQKSTKPTGASMNQNSAAPTGKHQKFAMPAGMLQRYKTPVDRFPRQNSPADKHKKQVVLADNKNKKHAAPVEAKKQAFAVDKHHKQVISDAAHVKQEMSEDKHVTVSFLEQRGPVKDITNSAKITARIDGSISRAIKAHIFDTSQQSQAQQAFASQPVHAGSLQKECLKEHEKSQASRSASSPPQGRNSLYNVTRCQDSCSRHVDATEQTLNAPENTYDSNTSRSTNGNQVCNTSRSTNGNQVCSTSRSTNGNQVCNTSRSTNGNQVCNTSRSTNGNQVCNTSRSTNGNQVCNTSKSTNGNQVCNTSRSTNGNQVYNTSRSTNRNQVCNKSKSTNENQVCDTSRSTNGNQVCYTSRSTNGNHVCIKEIKEDPIRKRTDKDKDPTGVRTESEMKRESVVVTKYDFKLHGKDGHKTPDKGKEESAKQTRGCGKLHAAEGSESSQSDTSTRSSPDKMVEFAIQGSHIKRADEAGQISPVFNATKKRKKSQEPGNTRLWNKSRGSLVRSRAGLVPSKDVVSRSPQVKERTFSISGSRKDLIQKTTARKLAGDDRSKVKISKGFQHIIAYTSSSSRASSVESTPTRASQPWWEKRLLPSDEIRNVEDSSSTKGWIGGMVVGPSNQDHRREAVITKDGTKREPSKEREHSKEDVSCTSSETGASSNPLEKQHQTSGSSASDEEVIFSVSQHSGFQDSSSVSTSNIRDSFSDHEHQKLGAVKSIVADDIVENRVSEPQKEDACGRVSLMDKDESDDQTPKQPPSTKTPKASQERVSDRELSPAEAEDVTSSWYTNSTYRSQADFGDELSSSDSRIFDLVVRQLLPDGLADTQTEADTSSPSPPDWYTNPLIDEEEDEELSETRR
ncbi:hypothetical protein PoB_007378800 [Plakobranchus ocellatus]|uniref:Uncharacterized protein n=1 Tax=Plakobranchus ocellatus TaxID=259542 RepID=A0AAV4DSJ3_9GAST|nr:hypothetical protein PoB_007378800 [Plakobranchus ocellatus]